MTQIFQRTVSIIIFYDKNHNILLQDRTGISKIGEEWAFFGGGRENNESPEETLLREVKEELNYDISDYQYLGLHKTKEDIYHISKHVFISQLNDKQKEFKQIEGKNMQLFSINSAKQLKMVPGDTQTIEFLENYFKNN